MNTPEYINFHTLMSGTMIAVGALTVRLFIKENARNNQMYGYYNKGNYGFRNEQVIDNIHQRNGSSEGLQFYTTKNGEGVRIDLSQREVQPNEDFVQTEAMPNVEHLRHAEPASRQDQSDVA